MLDRLKSFLHLTYLEARACIKEGRRVYSPGGPEPRLYYGHDHVPGREEKSSGGMVKYQDLSVRFPNTVNGANIVYLVSSALPLFPEYVLRKAKVCGVKIVINQNGVAFPAYHAERCEIINGPRRRLMQMADYVIYQSDFSRIASDKYLCACNAPSIVLHNPVDTEVFVPAGRYVKGREMVLLLAGSHRHEYRISTALEVLSVLRRQRVPAVLRIAGNLAWDKEEKCRESVKALAEKLGIEGFVKIEGSYTQNQAVKVLQDCDILVHTQYMDCCPRLVVEAMACGKPVIYSASGGVTELVGKEAGIGVSVSMDWNKIQTCHPSLMAEACVKVMDNYESYSGCARKRAVDRFDVSWWRKKHSEIFDAMLR